jgi:mono/diheme cytochrome c family protein
MPGPGNTHPALPDQPVLDATPEVISRGKALYAENCKGCHGVDATARFGGSVPDLRYANKATHSAWHGIVVGGARIPNGMPSFELEIEESEAIRNYVLSLAEELRRN